MGVDVFFVLSGYLIAAIAAYRDQSGGFSAVNFYAARIRRLFPALLIVLIANLAAGWWLLLPSEFSALARHLKGSLGFYENYVLSREAGYFTQEVALKPLAHLWSLGVEAQFYLWFPVLFYGILKRPALAWLGLGGLVLGSFFWAVSSAGFDAGDLYLQPLSRFWELAIGVSLARLERGWPFLPGASLPGSVFHRLREWVGLGLILGSAGALNPGDPYPGWTTLGPVMGTALLVAAHRPGVVGRGVLENRILVELGLISYPLYLWHWSLRSFFLIEWGHDPSISEGLVLLSLSVLLARLTYRGLEVPIRRLSPGSHLQARLLAVAFGVFGLAQSVLMTHGYPHRFKDLAILEPGGYPVEWRIGQCLLDGRQRPADFSTECFSQGEGPKEILLYGDSFAAQLLPGLSAALIGEARLTQATMVACFPGHHYQAINARHCPELADFVDALVQGRRFDRVVIAANWEKYPKELVFSGLSETLARFKAQGLKVTVFGPPPRWSSPLPQRMARVYRDHPNESLPTRLPDPSFSVTAAEDRRLAQWVRGLGVDYVSLVERLCDDHGCLVRLDDQLTSMDEEHLTVSAARWLFESQ